MLVHAFRRFALCGLFALSLAAGGEETRKLKSGTPPEYPELARKFNLKGTAKVEVTVAADGNVKNVRELGGNPVLVDALVRAVKKWKYVPAEKESVFEVRFDFAP